MTVAPEVREVLRADRPRWTARENALRKNAWCRERFPGHDILTADTVVVFRGRCIGKPSSLREATSFLRMFSGHEQRILTAIALSRPRRPCRCEVVESVVQFKRIPARIIMAYLAKVDPMDKAGAYDIDQHGEMIIESCAGSRSNVAGLPVERVKEWLGPCSQGRVRPGKV